jgi:hypothetical protein
MLRNCRVYCRIRYSGEGAATLDGKERRFVTAGGAFKAPFPVNNLARDDIVKSLKR